MTRPCDGGGDGIKPPGIHGRMPEANGWLRRFEAARTAFETAWRLYLPKRSEADFRAWRDQQAWTEEKYARFDRGERMQPVWRSHASAELAARCRAVQLFSGDS